MGICTKVPFCIEREYINNSRIEMQMWQMIVNDDKHKFFPFALSTAMPYKSFILNTFSFWIVSCVFFRNLACTPMPPKVDPMTLYVWEESEENILGKMNKKKTIT